jgi:hypothetical protein
MSFLVNSFVYGSGAVPLDPDAVAFLTAASITDATQQSAVNQLVVDLKGYGVWTKMKALYPFVGGTASTHKWNLKDPQDTNGAFRLTFSGGWTHSANGALPNGTNAYANTYLLPQTQISQNSVHVSSYARTIIVNSNDNLIGCYGGVTSSAIRIVCEGGTSYRTETNNLFLGADFTNIIHDGFFVNSRNSASLYKSFRSGTTLTTKTISSLPPSHLTIFISATNGEFGISQYSKREQAFASIGDGLSDTEAANFYTAVQAFQTTLGRQV